MSSKYPLVISRRYGKEYLRSRPVQVKQTEATLQAAMSFGKVSSLTSQLVSTFKPLIPTTEGQRIYHRMLAALVKWQQDLLNNPMDPAVATACLNGFCFVQQSSLAKLCRIAYEVQFANNGAVNIQLPAFVPTQAIKAPKGCKKITIRWMAVSCLPSSGEVLGMQSAEVIFGYNDDTVAAQQLQLQVPVVGACLRLVAVALSYGKINTHLKQMPAKYLEWLPCGIVKSLFV